MLEYIIKKSDNILYIAKDNLYLSEDISFQKYINKKLLFHLTTLSALEKTTRKIFKFKSKIPLLIDKETLLMPIISYRMPESVYLNYLAIKSFEKRQSFIIVNFVHGHSLKINQECAFMNQIKKARIILSHFENLTSFF